MPIVSKRDYRIEALREAIIPGTRVELLEEMADPYTPLPAGLKGTVEFWDDGNQIHVRWDNHSGLSLIPGVDHFRVIEEKKSSDELVRSQILKVRDTGRTNMFDLKMVQVIANEMELYELVKFIEEHRDNYVRFILTGKFMEDK